MAEERYNIAIIVTWFGKLPIYFDAWLKSAEYNNTIDIIIFSDQEISSNSTNIHFYKTTMQEELKKYSKKIKRPITIDNAYKFCDCRLFFGLFYEDYLKEYDFWGYCDIDLIFGNIRKFVTDKILEKYDRVYPYGHLSLYRNTKKMNHLYKLPGSIYSLKEIFEGTAKTTVEEYFGANRICIKNNIKWYTNIDFADLMSYLPKRLNMAHSRINNNHQIFIWDQGSAYRLYYIGQEQKKEELVYIHWQKRKPQIDCGAIEMNEKTRFIITSDKIMTNWNGKFTVENMDRLNPPMSNSDIRKANKTRKIRAIKRFLKEDKYMKKILLRQFRYRIIEKVTKERTYN